MADSDKDGLTDEVERILGTDPQDKDTDNDGLMDGAEGKLGADPKNPDSDGDGFADGSEVAQRRSPWNPDPPHPQGARDRPYQPTADDPDADGLDEMMEGLAGTDPNDPDTDGDGLGDSVEAIRGTNPKARFGDEPGDASNDLDDARTEVFTRRSQFVEHARIQIGDKYKFGAETTPGQDDPDAFDSSELVQWAAGRAGVNLPDGSWNQYKHLHQAGGSVTVKDALGTPGALVFGFSSDPLATSGRPARSYVGISLGDGRVIDVSERTGQVSELDPGSFYTHAAVIPEFEQDLDSDGDGATNWDERRRNSDPLDPAKTSQSEAQPPVAPKSPDDTSAATDAGDQVAQAADASERSEDVLESGTSMASAGTQLASLSSDIGDPAATAQATMQLAVDRSELTDPFDEGGAQGGTASTADAEASADSTAAQDATAANGEQDSLLHETMPGESGAEGLPSDDDTGSYTDTSSYDTGASTDTSTSYDESGSYGDSSSYDTGASTDTSTSSYDDSGSYTDSTSSSTSAEESYSYSE